jgi:hypothetical protein
VPKRSASRGQPRRKRGRRRYVVPMAPPGPAQPGSDAPNVVPFPVRSQPASEAPSTRSRLAAREHLYVNRELVRIAVIAVVILVLLVALTFVL